ncbi:MAG: hypothetical protein CL916_11465 [Deltaproteobacteria bacterium]|nr:hypothetical protein [Deltaproteobacteria bacterium]
MLLLMFFGCTNPCFSEYSHLEKEDIDINGETWTRTALTEGICGSAFISSDNIDDDPDDEVIITNFNRPDGMSLPNGFVTAYHIQEEPSYTQPVSEDMGYKWPNDVVVHDVDQDGSMDLVVGFGFLTCEINPWTDNCGGLAWFSRTDSGWEENVLVPKGSTLFYHKVLFIDIDNDGIEDLLAAGERYATPFGGIDDAQFQYWLGLGDGKFSSEPQTLFEGMGSLPELFDVDQDGDLDIISGEYFSATAQSAVWIEQKEGETISERWEKHTIDNSSGPSIQVSMAPNLFGDGQNHALLSNHTNTEMNNPDTNPSGLYLLTPTEDPTEEWTRTTIYDQFISSSESTQAAPGVFSIGDIDGDADMDILISGDGDPRIFWMEQKEGTFIEHVLMEDMPQAGVHIADTNHDGINEMFVGSYDRNVVFWFSRGVQ